MRGCDVTSCAYPVAAKNIRDNANAAAASLLIVPVAEDAGKIAHPDATDLKPLDMEKLLQTSCRLF
jgi:hypothetical protein